jgi:two-component system, NarL family, nitrate/nitrite response regulator NarL
VRRNLALIPVTHVVVGDDHAVFVDALCAVLAQQGCVVAKATTVADTVDAVRRHQPDICLIDHHFREGEDSEGCAGIAAIPSLADACARTKVLILSADGDSDVIMQAMRAGAGGFVHKTRGVSVLRRAIERVLRGEVVVEAPAGGSVQPHLARRRDALRLAAYLTAREWQCLELLVEGQDTAGIVAALGVSAATVRTHVQSLLIKLGVHSRLEAAAFAVQHGLLDRTVGPGDLAAGYAS